MKNNDKITAYRGSLVIPGGRTGVLLIHSLGGNPIELRFVAQSLARQGYTVYCPLLPGMGGGTDVSGLSTRHDWYNAVEAAHDELKARCDIILVGGMSAGCMLALRLAEERPDHVHGLMMFAPTFWPNGWAIPKYFHLFRLFRHKFFSQFIQVQLRAPYGIKDERIRNFVIESFKSEDRPIEDMYSRGGKLVWEFKRLAIEVRKGLGKINQHMLVFHPREDDQSDMSNSMLLARQAKGLVEMVVLDDSYHMVTLDRQRSIVVDRVVDFAQRLSQSIADKQATSRQVAGNGAAE